MRARSPTRSPTRSPVPYRGEDWPDVSLQPPANQDVLTAMDRLRADLTTQIGNVAKELSDFRQTLPDSYPPRREIDQRVVANSAEHAAFTTRITALEEWRLGETQRAADRQAMLQAQIQAVVSQQIKDNAADKLATQQAVSAQRATLDGKTIALYGAIILLFLGFMFNFLSAHVMLK